MTTTIPTNDYFGSVRPALRTRAPSTFTGPAASPGSPRTPLLGRSISSQFGSPSAYRSEPEEVIVYELGARHLSAGFAGETRPRCVVHFTPDCERRLGDYRACDPAHRPKRRRKIKEADWGGDHELYRIDLRATDVALVEDRLERALRTIHVDHLQLDQKARKAILIVPSLLPTDLLETALRVLFNHSTRPPSVNILTTPLLAVVGAGLRNALVVDIGWGETVITAVGEYREICQRRSVRAGRLLTREMARVLDKEMTNQRQDSDHNFKEEAEVGFEYSEQATQRMAWCRARAGVHADIEQSGMVTLPSPDFHPSSSQPLHIPFQRFSDAAETALFAPSEESGDDDHNLALPMVAYRVLLALPIDLRAICVSHIIITGGSSALPGLKQRMLQEISHLIDTRQWDPVNNYGSASMRRKGILRERSANITPGAKPKGVDDSLSFVNEVEPHLEASEREHDDKSDSITQKVEREANKAKPAPTKAEAQGLETVGAWAGASLMASLKVKGVHDVEREDFLKHGLKDESTLLW